MLYSLYFSALDTLSRYDAKLVIDCVYNPWLLQAVEKDYSVSQRLKVKPKACRTLELCAQLIVILGYEIKPNNHS